MTLLPTVENETAADPVYSVIWLHGLGADGNDFAPIVPALVAPQWPGLRFVFPHAPVRHAQKLAGIVALSTYLPLADSLAAERSAANAGVPIFWGHGTFDPVVVLQRGVDSRTALEALGYRLDWHTYPMPHSVSPEEIADLQHWMTQRLR